MSITVADNAMADGVPTALSMQILSLLCKRKYGGIDPAGNVYTFDGTHLLPTKRGVVDLVEHAYNKGEIKFRSVDGRGAESPLPLPFALSRIQQIARYLEMEPTMLRSALLRFDCIARLPQVSLQDGTDRFVQEEPGLREGIWYVGNKISVEKVDPTYPHLRTLFSGVKFMDPAMLGNVLGWYVATFARVWCEKFPYLMIDAPGQDSGKTTVAEALCAAIVPGGVSGTSLDSTGEPQGTTFATEAGKPGPVPFLLDNLGESGRRNRTLKSPLLAQMATGRSVQLRRKYAADRMPISFPVVVMTMNQAILSLDLSSRVVHVRVDNGTCKRVTPYPPQYVAHHYNALRAESIHLLTSHEFPQDDRTRFFSFHRVAAGVAKVLNLPYNFDPQAFSTVNAVVLELYSVLSAEKEPTSLRSLVATIHDRDKEMTEVRGYLEGQYARSVAAEIKVLIELFKSYGDRVWHLHDKSFVFELKTTEDFSGPTVTVKEIEK